VRRWRERYHGSRKLRKAIGGPRSKRMSLFAALAGSAASAAGVVTPAVPADTRRRPTISTPPVPSMAAQERPWGHFAAGRCLDRLNGPIRTRGLLSGRGYCSLKLGSGIGLPER
jgi:hypothetical protein